MPTIEVNCTVSDCVFHEISNICGAKEILVDVNYHPNKNTEFASDFDYRMDTKKVSSSVNTCCKTFKPKHWASEKI